MMRRAWWALAILPMVALALYPPTGFDETLYHLPMVRAIAERGFGFHEDLRFPVFPLLAELLAVPFYAIGGDVATHAIPLLAMLLTAAVLIAWGRHRGIRTGPLAAAAFLGAPIVVHLGTSLYVDVVLTFFVCAGFYCIDRCCHRDDTPLIRPTATFSPLRRGEGNPMIPMKWPSPLRRGEKVPQADEGSLRIAIAGLLLGAACATKYLGLYFAFAGAIVIALGAGGRGADVSGGLRRSLLPYLAGCAVVALPMYAWIYAQSGNPVFPFFGTSPWVLHLPSTRAPFSLLRLPFDAVFARARVGMQPPFTPFFAPALIAIAWKARPKLLLPLGYLIAFLFLPNDVRYLVPLLPLVLIEAATVLDRVAMPRWLLTALVVIAIAPGPAYAIYRIAKQGSPFDRTAYLRRAVPEYRALEQAGTSRVYACRGEQLMWHARGPFLGDHVGPHSYARVLRGDVHANLVALDVDHLLIAKDCWFRPGRGFELVYADEGAQLYAIRR